MSQQPLPHPQSSPALPPALVSLGFKPSHAAAFALIAERGLLAARVARADRDRLLVLTAPGETPRPAVVRGRLRHEAASPADLPAVGDWVAIEPATDGPSLIHAVLPRASAFTRLDVGRETLEQVVAANVDVLFLVSGLDRDFNPRRIERFVVGAWESGARPVVVLNKADLLDEAELDRRIGAIQAGAPGVPVIAVSAAEGAGLEALTPHLAPGSTVALVGSSGVGKSTLINALLGEARLDTGEVRADDQRGRHTTTWRELVALPGGALLVDTPGMRRLALWGDEGEAMLERGFADVDALAAACRFRDCAHQGEPGCAVDAAAADGTLEPGRLANWQKLRRELRAFEIRHDARAQKAEKARWKTISKTVRAHMKRKYGE